MCALGGTAKEELDLCQTMGPLQPNSWGKRRGRNAWIEKAEVCPSTRATAGKSWREPFARTRSPSECLACGAW